MFSSILEKQIDFVNSNFNRDSTFIAFTGWGKSAYFKKITDEFLYDSSKFLLLYFSVSEFQKNPKNALEHTVLKSELKFEKIPDNLFSIVKSLLLKKTNIFIVIDDAHLLYKPQFEEILVDVTASKTASPKFVNLLFLSAEEPVGNELAKLGKIAPMFLNNLNWANNLKFKKSEVSFFIEKMSECKLEPNSLDKVIEISGYDSSVLKYVATILRSDRKKFLKVLQDENISYIYEMLGNKYLDLRFWNLINTLGTESLEYLTLQKTVPSDFLVNVDLIFEKDSKYNYRSKLFEHFVIKNQDKISKRCEDLKTGISRELIEELSASEIDVLKILLKNKENYVNKDELASAVWGTDFEKDYSEWALLKLMNRLGKKLKTHDYILKSKKGIGFALFG